MSTTWPPPLPPLDTPPPEPPTQPAVPPSLPGSPSPGSNPAGTAGPGRRFLTGVIVGAVIGALVAGGIVARTQDSAIAGVSAADAKAVAAARSALLDHKGDIHQIVAAVGPSVVSVERLMPVSASTPEAPPASGSRCHWRLLPHQVRRLPKPGNGFYRTNRNSPAAVRSGVRVEIRYSLRLPRDVVTVPLVRTICRDAMNRLGVTPDCQGDFALALSEACANVVQHAGGDDDEYDVQIEFAGGICHIRVLDKGRGIDLRDSARTETILDQDSGRGIVLMRLMADRIAFESRPEDGTIVHLQKRLELEENALLASL